MSKKTLLVDLCYKKNSLSSYEFLRPISKITGKCTLKHYSEIEEKDLEFFEKIILCGTSLKDSNYMKNLKKFEWLRKTEKNILGICAGMQVIGLVFGAKIIKNKEIGIKEINTKKHNKLFDGNLRVYELHNYSIKDTDFEILAESDKCIQAIKHRSKNIYGIMFHPEVRQEEVVKKFLEI